MSTGIFEQCCLDIGNSDELSSAAGSQLRLPGWREETMSKDNNLKSAIDSGEFIVTAEITPKLTADGAALVEQARPLRDRVHAVNVTDGAGARVTMSSLAAAALLARDGIEPVMQMSCRDRNRIAIPGDLIGAAALGIENILVLTGDDPKVGDEPDAKAVFDFTTLDIIALACRMRDEGLIASGREMLSRPAFNIGVVDVPIEPAPGWKPDRLAAKIEAGASFVQAQFCFDPGLVERYFQALGDAGILDSIAMIVGVGPIASARSARWMNDNLFGVTVPEKVIQRIEGADDQAEEGRRICVELIETYKKMPGVSGVHIMAPAQGPQRIADIIDEALAA
jgi:methylenetetrahydrofolate reductase (NADPH)